MDSRKAFCDLQIASSKVTGEVHDLMEALQAIDAARTGRRQNTSMTGMTNHNEFTPWKGGGLDRLLLKFDLANMDR